MDPLLTAVNSIHPVDEPPLASGIDWVFELVHVSLGLLLLDGIPRAFVWFSAGHVSRATVYVIWKVFRGFCLVFLPVMYQGPLFMSFGRYFVGFCLVFLPVMYLGAVYLLFGWYSVGCFILFTCLLSFGYRHVDFLTLPVYRISSVSILSYCYPMVCASLPVACEAHPVEIRVWRSRSSSSSGI